MGRNTDSEKTQELQKTYKTFVVTIRNLTLPKRPRVFDVIVNEQGEILRYESQNIKGSVYVDRYDVQRQIKDALEKNIIA